MGARQCASRRRALALALVAGTLAALIAAGLPGQLAGASRGGFLFMLPALALAAALLLKRYPGERAIERLRTAWSAPRHARVGAVPRPRPRPRPHRCGGRLIAISLAGRAPPLLAGGR
jgi:hypothetical protein